MTEVSTVLGLMDSKELGITHSHEHILWDYWNLINSYDCIHDEESVAIDELRDYAAAGGGSMLDCSSVGIRTDVSALRRVSEASGIPIVLGTGFYRERVYPREVFTKTISQLADQLQREIVDGIDGTGIRAGFIGEIGTEREYVSPAEERVFRAAARAALRTGVTVITHTTHFGELAHEQIDILQDEGLPTEQIVISHLGDRVEAAALMAVAARGVYLSIDNIGYCGDGYPDDDVRADNVVSLVRAGYGGRVVLACDISTRSALRRFGGRGYGHLLRTFVPLLEKRGLKRSEIECLLITNIADALTSGGTP